MKYIIILVLLPFLGYSQGKITFISSYSNRVVYGLSTGQVGKLLKPSTVADWKIIDTGETDVNVYNQDKIKTIISVKRGDNVETVVNEEKYFKISLVVVDGDVIEITQK